MAIHYSFLSSVYRLIFSVLNEHCFFVCSNQLASCSWISFCQWWIRWLHDVLGGWVSSVHREHCNSPYFIFNSSLLEWSVLAWYPVLRWELKKWCIAEFDNSLVLPWVFDTSSFTSYQQGKDENHSIMSLVITAFRKNLKNRILLGYMLFLLTATRSQLLCFQYLLWSEMPLCSWLFLSLVSC